ncbi:RTA1 like protein-domain-containing protein [Elsinoe ampelina]|uniref:RTA1 like protein-domain-containing protein n=1 Tax=Elsinoe ampelina TaxID=302913 RepID=A0A6A6FYR0_9PEZI|nr:RTA1 like protein-domain-containing protein [Elsinoe ampelina]
MAVLESHNGYYLWHYLPSVLPAAIFVILFALSFAYLTFRLVKTRTWFCIPFLVGILFETIGYIGRALAHNRTADLPPYIMQSTLILLAPALLAASVYMVLARVIITVDGSSLSIVPVRRMTLIFVLGDVFSFLVQASGAGVMVMNKSNSMKMGSNIIMAGLVIQILIFGFFCVTAGVWHKRMNRVPPAAAFNVEVPWGSMMGMLYGVSGLIMVRSVFRLIEYGQGNDGYLLSTEWPLYVFDAVLMWLVTVLWAWRYPTGISKGRRTGVEAGFGRGGVEMESKR